MGVQESRYSYKNQGFYLQESRYTWAKIEIFSFQDYSEHFKNEFDILNNCRYLVLPEVCTAKSETYVPCLFLYLWIVKSPVKQFVNGTFLNCVNVKRILLCEENKAFTEK